MFPGGAGKRHNQFFEIFIVPSGSSGLTISHEREKLMGLNALPGWRCAVLPDLSGYPRVARVEPPAVVVGTPAP